MMDKFTQTADPTLEAHWNDFKRFVVRPNNASMNDAQIEVLRQMFYAGALACARLYEEAATQGKELGSIGIADIRAELQEFAEQCKKRWPRRE
jgi:hypothetical protein